jgi:hypothetical protein
MAAAAAAFNGDFNPVEAMEAIKKAIAPLCTTTDSLEEASMNIYLTIMNVRPACLPFDTETIEVMLKKYKENPEVEAQLKTIPNLKVFVGPYYDSGEVILIASKKALSFVEPRLRRLEEIAGTTSKRGDIPELHILIGEILGYICPADMGDLWKQKIVDDYAFLIDGREHMPVWCVKDAKFKKAADELLENMNKALAPLGKHATLIMKDKQMANSEGGRRKRKTRKSRKSRRARRRH